MATASESAIRLLQLTENAVRTPPPILEEASAIRGAITEDKLSIRDLDPGYGAIAGQGQILCRGARQFAQISARYAEDGVCARTDTLRHARHLAGIEDEALRGELIAVARDEGIGEREVKRRIEGATAGENNRGLQGSQIIKEIQAETPSLRGAVRATIEAIERLRRAVLSDEECQKARAARDIMRAMPDEWDGILG